MGTFMVDPSSGSSAYNLLCQNYDPYQPTNISFTEVNDRLFRVV